MFYGTMVLASFRLNYLSTRYGHRKLLIVSAALFPVFPLLLGFAKGPELYYLACLTGGAVYAVLTGALINRLMDRVPDNDRPGHMAVHNLALNIGILAGSLLGPLFAGLIGLRLSMFLFVSLRFLSAILFSSGTSAFYDGRIG
jgi:MFS family permease